MGERFLEWCTGRRVLAALVLFMVVGFGLFNLGPYPRLKALTEEAPFPEEAVTTPEQLAVFLQEIGPVGRDLYLSFQLWDVANPLLIGFLGLVLVGWMVRRGTESEGRVFLLAVPVITPGITY